MKFKKNEGENKGFFLPGGPFSDNSTNLKRNFAKYVVLHRFTITNYRSMFLNAIWRNSFKRGTPGFLDDL